MLALITSHWWAMLLLGIVAGTLGGLLGVGGGIIMVPLLVLILALPQKAAQGISLTVMVPMALVAALRYWTGPHMEVAGFTRADVFLLAVFVCVGAVAGAFLGTHISGRLPNSTLRVVFAVFMILVGVYMLLPKPWEKGASIEGPAAQSGENPGGVDNAAGR